jgi:hypothetical protein
MLELKCNLSRRRARHLDALRKLRIGLLGSAHEEYAV